MIRKAKAINQKVAEVVGATNQLMTFISVFHFHHEANSMFVVQV
ncbi:MAG: hypothetical protein QM660_08905 [Dysgonomonas sp.]